MAKTWKPSLKPPAQESWLPGDGVAAGVARPVEGAMQDARLLATVLHDVDLAAVRPAHLLEVGPQQPERRPDPLPHRELDARLEPAARLLEEALRVDAARRVVAGPRYSSSSAVIARFPSPSSETFSGRSVSYSSWSLPQSVPMSKRHFVESGSCPAGPSNSSDQTRPQLSSASDVLTARSSNEPQGAEPRHQDMRLTLTESPSLATAERFDAGKRRESSSAAFSTSVAAPMPPTSGPARWPDLGRGDRAHERAALRRLAERLEQQLAQAGEVPADHDHRGVHEIEKAGHHDAQMPGRLLDDLQRERIAGERRLLELADGDRVPASMLFGILRQSSLARAPGAPSVRSGSRGTR